MSELRIGRSVPQGNVETKRFALELRRGEFPVVVEGLEHSALLTAM